ncbi:MAG: glycosyltransferase [Desulfobulbaceae bacterium]|nr:glycosyltransferase [Desulfobulbaceae bacterium]
MATRLAYLVSEYPGISHTFIFREICSLRHQGVTVLTASIRKPAYLHVMTGAEKEEANETLYIKDSSAWEIIRAHLSLILKHPVCYWALLWAGLALVYRGPKSIIKAVGYLAEAGVLVAWMLSNKTFHIHVHFASPAATVAMLASAFADISFSVSVHGPDALYNVDTYLLPEKIKKSQFIRCISHYSKSQLQRLVPYKYWEKIRIVRCGVDPEVYRPVEHITGDKPEILCVGRLVPSKGQHVLVNAVKVLKQRAIAFHLTMVGDGEDMQSLQVLTNELVLQDSILFTGALGQHQVRDYYDKADIFVLPSFAEGVPVVLMEAMAKEIPVVSTLITGIPELITNDKDGILVSPADHLQLADALERLLLDAEMRKEMGRKGRQKVVAKYNLENNNKKMVELFQQYVL